MEKEKKLTLWLELLCWVFTALVAFAVLYPIRQATANWPFQLWNIVFVVTLLTLVRYIFLLPHTFLARRQVLKIVLLLLMFPLTFVMIDHLNAFLQFAEQDEWQAVIGHLPPVERQSMLKYMRGEMIFFGVGCVLAAPAFAIRMMMSIWRLRNRGTI